MPQERVAPATPPLNSINWLQVRQSVMRTFGLCAPLALNAWSWNAQAGQRAGDIGYA